MLCFRSQAQALSIWPRWKSGLAYGQLKLICCHGQLASKTQKREKNPGRGLNPSSKIFFKHIVNVYFDCFDTAIFDVELLQPRPPSSPSRCYTPLICTSHRPLASCKNAKSHLVYQFCCLLKPDRGNLWVLMTSVRLVSTVILCSYTCLIFIFMLLIFT